MMNQDFMLYLLLPWALTLVAFTFIMLYVVKGLSRFPLFHAKNYADKTVYYGLGFVWLPWGALVLALGYVNVLTVASLLEMPHDTHIYKILSQLLFPFSHNFLILAVPLAILCFFFGLLDDMFSEHDESGFKGHISALIRGKITTGMGKLLGIGIVSLGVSMLYFVSSSYRIGYIAIDSMPLGLLVGYSVLGGLAIALTANLLNLTDLRPARASKVYLVLLLIAVIIAPENMAVIALLALPIMATWSLDAGEKAMLGDAGVNPAGAVMGLYFVHIISAEPLAWVWLMLYVTIMFLLNLASEKISFSAVIERNKLLKMLDMIGRPKPPTD